MAKAKYKRRFKPNHHRADIDGCVKEHILIAEEILGRPISNKEVVHHKDGNTFNNEKENLLVFKTINDHSCFHKGGKLVPLEDGTYKCISQKKIVYCSCGKLINYKATKCTDCHNANQRKHIPSREELESIIWSKPTSDIAKDFNVSDKAVEKWCKKYGIKKPPRGYWQKVQHGKF